MLMAAIVFIVICGLIGAAAGAYAGYCNKLGAVTLLNVLVCGVLAVFVIPALILGMIWVKYGSGIVLFVRFVLNAPDKAFMQHS